MDITKRQQAIKQAIGQHGLWKARLYHAIDAGKSDFTVDTVSGDQKCEFGKWLYGDPSLKAQTPVHFQKVRQLHEDFHREVGRILSLALQERKAEALKAFESNTPFTKISAALTTEMIAWSRV